MVGLSRSLSAAVVILDGTLKKIGVKILISLLNYLSFRTVIQVKLQHRLHLTRSSL